MGKVLRKFRGNKAASCVMGLWKKIVAESSATAAKPDYVPHGGAGSPRLMTVRGTVLRWRGFFWGEFDE
jgi:hypothetical protein